MKLIIFRSLIFLILSISCTQRNKYFKDFSLTDTKGIQEIKDKRKLNDYDFYVEVLDSFRLIAHSKTRTIATITVFPNMNINVFQIINTNRMYGTLNAYHEKIKFTGKLSEYFDIKI